MSITDGYQAIISRLLTESSGVNIVLPDGPGKTLPRYVVQEAGGSQRVQNLDGDVAAMPEVMVMVETADGQYTTQSNALVKSLVDIFPVGSRFGGMEVVAPPDVRPPLPAHDGVYSVPVYVSARFVY